MVRRSVQPATWRQHFPSKAHYHHFTQTFRERKIHDPRILDFAYFHSKHFTFQHVFERYGLADFLQIHGDIYPFLVKLFYFNLDLNNGLLTSIVKGVKISLTLEEFSDLAGVPYYGPTNFPAEDKEEEVVQPAQWVEGFQPDTIRRELLVPDARTNVRTPYACDMSVYNRLLHYVLVRILTPRGGNFAVIQRDDVLPLWAIINEKKISWGYYIANHMITTCQKKLGMLPYPALITRILEHFNVPLGGEERRADEECTKVFTERNILQMGLKRVRGEWIYSYHCDNIPEELEEEEEEEADAPLPLPPSTDIPSSSASPSDRQLLQQLLAQNAQILSTLQRHEAQMTCLTSQMTAIQEHLGK